MKLKFSSFNYKDLKNPKMYISIKISLHLVMRIVTIIPLDLEAKVYPTKTF